MILEGVPSIIESIFGALTNIVSQFTTMLTSLFTNVVALVYNSSTGELTVVGTLLLVGLATGLVIWAFNFIRRLIRVRTK